MNFEQTPLKPKNSPQTSVLKSAIIQIVLILLWLGLFVFFSLYYKAESTCETCFLLPLIFGIPLAIASALITFATFKVRKILAILGVVIYLLMPVVILFGSQFLADYLRDLEIQRKEAVYKPEEVIAIKEGQVQEALNFDSGDILIDGQKGLFLIKNNRIDTLPSVFSRVGTTFSTDKKYAVVSSDTDINVYLINSSTYWQIHSSSDYRKIGYRTILPDDNRLLFKVEGSPIVYGIADLSSNTLAYYLEDNIIDYLKNNYPEKFSNLNTSTFEDIKDDEEFPNASDLLRNGDLPQGVTYDRASWQRGANKIYAAVEKTKTNKRPYSQIIKEFDMNNSTNNIFFDPVKAGLGEGEFGSLSVKSTGEMLFLFAPVDRPLAKSGYPIYDLYFLTQTGEAIKLDNNFGNFSIIVWY